MKLHTQGIHHVTAISGDAQRTLDFYAGTLGLRFVKKTVNHDDPYTYHLYFGNHNADPGTLITFFPWEGAKAGGVGTGQIGVLRLAVPPHSLAFWKKRLRAHDVPYTLRESFQKPSLAFRDPHGLPLEFIETESGKTNHWRVDDITQTTAIKGFQSAVLFSANPKKTSAVLEYPFGFRKTSEEERIIRFKTRGGIGNIIDVARHRENEGRPGPGTFHHLAFRAKDEAEQDIYRESLAAENYRTTHRIDRKYFHSLYLRECGYILLEIATDGPGFAVDEAMDALATTLTLPDGYEKDRRRIESARPPLEVKNAYVKKDVFETK